MKRFEIGQRFWDERNCRIVEVVKFNGAAYYCKTIDYAGDDDAGAVGYQWFKASELQGFKPMR